MKFARKWIAKSANLLVRKFGKGILPGVYVFLYHGIEKTLSDSYMSVKAGTDLKNFSRHLDLFQEYFRLISLEDAVSILGSGTSISEKYAVITFDDAYKNVLENAVPLLDGCDIPSTIFVCHNPAASKKGSWRNRLALLLDCRKNAALEMFCKMLGQNFVSADELFGWCKNEYSLQLERCIDLVWNELKMADKDLPIYASYAELCSLSDSRYLFGSHTISHPVLSRIPAQAAHKEIILGHHLVENGLQRKLKFFAYPFGCPQHWNAECEQAVRKLSGVCGVDACGGINRGFQPLHIKRIGFTNQPLNVVKKVIAEESGK